LENIREYLWKKRSGWYGLNNYHVLTLYQDDVPVAVAICDYLAEPNTGIIEFLTVNAKWRKQGAGRAILDWTETVLRQDAVRAGKDLDWILAEMEDPLLVKWQGEGMDPVARASIWDLWGYAKLDFRYLQPSLGPGKKAVEHLLLMGKAMRESGQKQISNTVLLQALRGYMRWAMRIEEPEKNPEYVRIEEELEGDDSTSLIPLCP
jgi:GNAT superfamily N-acetyltransferase